MKIEIKKGTWRLAILLPCCGLALKLPRIHFYQGLKDLKNYLRKDWRAKKLKNIFRALFKHTVFTPDSLKGWFFRGMVENWQEWTFYRKSKNPFLLPTYFSIFGWLNIQQLGMEPEIEEQIFLTQLLIFSQSKTWGKHYALRKNFSFRNGKLQILDYGDPKVQRIVTKYGKIIQEKFDINYCEEVQNGNQKRV